MIGIIILGVGLVMVATMFPVAWTRARTLNEFTTERAANDTAHDAVRSLTRVSTASVGASSFLGDLTYDPQDPSNPNDEYLIEACPGFATLPAPGSAAPAPYAPPDWVHALHLENYPVARVGPPASPVDEEPWRLQDPVRRLEQDLQDLQVNSPPMYDLMSRFSFFMPRIALWQRVYPTMPPRPLNTDLDAVTAWEQDLDRVRYAFAVFHRLQQPISVTSVPELERTKTSARAFDMYYVLLRRGQPTYRYARQDPLSAPSPCQLSTVVVTPAAVDPNDQPDVMFPVAWRVQVQFPGQFPRTLKLRNNPAAPGRPSNATGIPTEIEVPPANAPGSDPEKFAWVQMFQPGTRFIDEITGMVFRVNKRRLNADGTQATLTLDREVFLNDIEIPEPDIDPRCPSCTTLDVDDPDAAADPAELLRTVWVFPPPVEARANPTDPLVFVGAQPVVSIEVRTLTIGPTY